MELQKGACFLCHYSKVITFTLAEKAFKVICSLFSKNVLNIAELDTLRSTLRFCPICFHKLLILERTCENIKTCSSEVECMNKCLLCNSGKVSFEIKDWPHFNHISGDLLSKNASYVICLDCLFYLDTRHEVKTKLFSKYPHLKGQSTNVHNNEGKRTSRDLSVVLSKSTDVLENEERTAEIDIINISAKTDGQPLRQKSFNYESLKKLKPLRYSKTFRQREIVKSDTKFLNQIPYVLLKTFKFSNKRSNTNFLKAIDDKEISAKIVHKVNYNVNNSKSSSQLNADQLTLRKKIKPRRLCPKSIKMKKEISKLDVVKDLVVNLPKINMLKIKPQNYNFEIEKLINKFTILQRSTRTNIDRIVEENTKNNLVSSLKETEQNNFEVKTKRKSASFAEEKNEEIETFQNSETNSNNEFLENLIEDDAVKEIVKKQNKHINFLEIKGVPEIDEECEIQNKKLIENPEECMNTDETVNSPAINKIGFKESVAEGNITNKEVSEEYSVNNDVNLVDDKKISTNRQIVEDKEINFSAQKKNKLKCRRKSVVFDSDMEMVREHEKSVAEDICDLKTNEPKPLVKEKITNILINLENTTEGNSSKLSKNINLENDEETIIRSNAKKVSNSETELDNINQIDSTDNDKNKSSSNELKELHENIKSDDKIKVTAIDIVNDGSLFTNNGKHIELYNIHEETKFEDKNEKDRKCKLPLNINIRDSSNIDINLDIEKETESNSKKTQQLLREYDKNECISGRQEVEDNSLNGTKNNIIKLTSGTEVSQLDVKNLKDLEDSEHHKNCCKSKSGNVSLLNEELEKVDLSLDDENKESDTGDSQTVNDSSKKNEENSNSNSDQSKFEISEHDKNNINSNLTDMFSQQEESENNTLNESKTIEKDVIDDVNHKRKMSVDELSSSMDKKKKKVTFYEDFT